jgi:hypothetical protein
VGNFSKNLQKANLLDQMQQRLNHAELAEARSVFMVACYEAMMGELPPAFLQQVQEYIKDEKATTKGAFYQAVFRAAQVVDQENAIAETEAAHLAAATAGLAPSHTASTAPQADVEIPPLASDTAGT